VAATVIAKNNVKTTKKVYKTLIMHLIYQSKYKTIKYNSGGAPWHIG